MLLSSALEENVDLHLKCILSIISEEAEPIFPLFFFVVVVICLIKLSAFVFFVSNKKIRFVLFKASEQNTLC